jgi:predicted amidophosphoribosyltransferase
VAEKYCRNCGQALPDDCRFCANCGTLILEAAHVPTPEAEVPKDPLQQIVEAHSARTAKASSAEP